MIDIDLITKFACKLQAWFRGYHVRKLLRLTLHYYQDIYQNIDHFVRESSPHYKCHLDNLSLQLSPTHTIISTLLSPPDRIKDHLIFAVQNQAHTNQLNQNLLSKQLFQEEANFRFKQQQEKDRIKLIKEAEWLESTIQDRLQVCVYLAINLYILTKFLL